MKKGIIIIGIVTWSILAVFLIWVLVFGISGRGFQMDEASLLKEEEVAMSDVSEVKVEGGSMGIEVVSIAGDQMKVSQYGKTGTKEADLFDVEQSGDTVKVTWNRNRRFKWFQINFGLNREKLIVELPESFVGNADFSASSGSIRLKDGFTLNDVNLSCTSGGIHIEKPLSANNLNLKVSSGGIRAEADVSVNDKLTVNGTSGGIHFNQAIRANEIYGKVSSGGIRLSETNVKRFDLNSTSGGVQVEGITGEGSVRVSSGGVRIRLKELSGNVDLRSTSGGVHITMDPSLDFQFEGRCTSGSIKANFPLEKNERGNQASATIGENPNVLITADSSSGGIRINQE